MALFVVPPFIIVGAVNTRGLRQSFFLGAMVSGMAHFVVNIYIAVMLTASLTENGLGADDFAETWIRYLNGFGFLLGSLGGLSGMATYYFLKLDGKTKAARPQIDHWEANESLSRPEIYPDSTTEPAVKEATLPR